MRGHDLVSRRAADFLRHLVDTRRDQVLQRSRQCLGAVRRAGTGCLGCLGGAARFAAFLGEQQRGEYQQLELRRTGELAAKLADLFLDIGGQFLDPRFLALSPNTWTYSATPITATRLRTNEPRNEGRTRESKVTMERIGSAEPIRRPLRGARG